MSKKWTYHNEVMRIRQENQIQQKGGDDTQLAPFGVPMNRAQRRAQVDKRERKDEAMTKQELLAKRDALQVRAMRLNRNIDALRSSGDVEDLQEASAREVELRDVEQKIARLER